MTTSCSSLCRLITLLAVLLVACDETPETASDTNQAPADGPTTGTESGAPDGAADLRRDTTGGDGKGNDQAVKPPGDLAGDSTATKDAAPPDAPQPDAAADLSVDAVTCTAASCDDKLPCTKDFCTDLGCVNQVKPGYCAVSGKCFKDGAMNHPKGCQICDSKYNATSWKVDFSLCPDDGLSCTATTCSVFGCGHMLKPAWCIINGKCKGNGSPLTPLGCIGCNTKNSTSKATPLNAGYPCTSDGLNCTLDVCGSAGTCEHKIIGNSCMFGKQCYYNGQALKPNGCIGCNAKTSQTKASALPKTAPCTSDGLYCTTDTCDGKGACQHAIVKGYCVINNKCIYKGQPGCK